MPIPHQSRADRLESAHLRSDLTFQRGGSDEGITLRLDYSDNLQSSMIENNERTSLMPLNYERVLGCMYLLQPIMRGA